MKLLSKRVWLNPDDSAFVFTELEQGSFGLDATLKISGGSDVINFWLSVSDKKDRKATVKMLLKLANSIYELHDVLKEVDE